MNQPVPPARLAQFKIGRISIRSHSSLDARRLADALPGLLAKRLADGPATSPPRRQSEWAGAADQIARVVEQQLGRGDG